MGGNKSLAGPRIILAKSSSLKALFGNLKVSALSRQTAAGRGMSERNEGNHRSSAGGVSKSRELLGDILDFRTFKVLLVRLKKDVDRYTM